MNSTGARPLRFPLAGRRKPSLAMPVGRASARLGVSDVATIDFPARRFGSAPEVETAVNRKGHTGDEACFY